MARTQSTHALASMGRRGTERQRPEPVTLELLDVDAQARRVCYDVTDDTAVKQRLRSEKGERLHRLLRSDGATRGLTIVAGEMIDLFNAGQVEAQVRRYEVFTREIGDLLYVGTARRTPEEVDRDNVAAENHERTLTVQRWTCPELRRSPAALRAEADAKRASAAADLEGARILEAEARRLEREQAGRPALTVTGGR